jgi:hypothetical protein
MSRGNIEGLYGETTEGIPFDISSHLTSMGKLIADRTGLIFMLKSKKTLTDETAEYSDTESANLVVEGNIVTAYVADYTSIVVDTVYYIGLGIKFAGDTTYREIRLVPGGDTIKFEQDVIRS